MFLRTNMAKVWSTSRRFVPIRRMVCITCCWRRRSISVSGMNCIGQLEMLPNRRISGRTSRRSIASSFILQQEVRREKCKLCSRKTYDNTPIHSQFDTQGKLKSWSSFCLRATITYWTPKMTEWTSSTLPRKENMKLLYNFCNQFLITW